MIRKVLDGLYLWSGYAAAAFILGIALSIVVQLVCRAVGVTFDATELAGFCLAAATFLGLAHTFRAGGHGRITLTLDRLPAGPRRAFEVFNCLVASAGILFLACYLIDLVLQSRSYHDVSPGLMAVPFWIPQSAAALGVAIFALSLIDELVWILRGGAPHFETDEDPAITHME